MIIAGRVVDTYANLHGFRIAISGKEAFVRNTWKPLYQYEGEHGRARLMFQLGLQYILPKTLPVTLLGRTAETHALIFRHKRFGAVVIVPWRKVFAMRERALLSALGGDREVLIRVFPSAAGGWNRAAAVEAVHIARLCAKVIVDLRPYGYVEHSDRSRDSGYCLRRVKSDRLAKGRSANGVRISTRAIPQPLHLAGHDDGPKAA